MLDYDWQCANTSPMMLSAEDSNVVIDQYAAAAATASHHSFSAGHILSGRPTGPATAFSPFFSPHHQQTPYGASPYPHGGDFSLESFSGGGDGGFLLPLPKSEEGVVLRPPPVDFTARLGLNLGGRTYFSTAEDDIAGPFYRRSRPPEAVKVIRCQAEGCNADLTHAKHYHRRHRVCEYHSKAAAVVAAGLTQRFCQQCSRFHLLSEFDNGKRSCRKRLADHNRRRRKSQLPNQGTQKPQLQGGRSISIDNFVKSPGQESGTQSSVTVAVSPPRMMLDCFELQRPYYNQAAASASSSSISSSSLFFSTS